MSELHKSATSRLEKLSFTQLFRGENDDANAYIDIQSGSEGHRHFSGFRKRKYFHNY